jgi:SAM-dependent methyltransferase
MLGGIYVGIDIDQNSSGTVDIVASASCVPLPNGSFDVIVCTEVVEHVSDTLSVFQEFFRLLAPKGYVILTTPFSYPLHEIPCDFVRLTPFQIEKLAHQSALDVVAMVRGGNEIEVMATVWDTMWRGMFGAKLNALSTVWIALMRALMNLPALVGSQLSGRFLPQRYYLSTLSILQRQSQTQ